MMAMAETSKKKPGDEPGFLAGWAKSKFFAAADHRSEVRLAASFTC